MIVLLVSNGNIDGGLLSIPAAGQAKLVIVAAVSKQEDLHYCLLSTTV